jgi:hypothetical protein
MYIPKGIVCHYLWAAFRLRKLPSLMGSLQTVQMLKGSAKREQHHNNYFHDYHPDFHD